MRFDSKNLSLECARVLLAYIGAYVDPKLSYSNDIVKIIKELNKFLDVIFHILNPSNKYTLSNYKIRGEYLLAFSDMYRYLVTHTKCKSTSNALVGYDKSWTKFLCTTKKGVRPIVHIYKVLAMIALIQAGCIDKIFYIKNTLNSGQEPDWLDIHSVLDNLHNPNLRFSKICLEKLEPDVAGNINKYVYTALYIRNQEYCSTIVKLNSDKEHETFNTCIEGLLKALEKYRSTHY